MDEIISKTKSKKKSIADVVATVICLAAAPIPCILLISAAISLQEHWDCIMLLPAILCFIVGAIAFFICFALLSKIIYYIIK